MHLTASGVTKHMIEMLLYSCENFRNCDGHLHLRQSTLSAKSVNPVVPMVGTSSPLSTAGSNPKRTETDSSVFTAEGHLMHSRGWLQNPQKSGQWHPTQLAQAS